MEFYKHVMKEGPRTKQAASKKKLINFGWTRDLEVSFLKLKQAIATTTQLAYPSVNKVQCIFTDASDLSCAGLVTQIPKEDLSKPFAQQRHEPLGFTGHRFSGSKRRWSTPDKEAKGIMHTFQKLQYLLVSPEIYLFTDHKNLTSIFDQETCTVQSSQRLTRWAMELMDYPRFRLKHISGHDNTWADLMSRWGNKLDDDIDWTSQDEPIQDPISIPIPVYMVLSDN
jgi:hypothetical protein